MKNSIKTLVLCSAVICGVCATTSCGGTNQEKYAMSAGLIALHDESSTYDANFIDGFKKACAAKNVKAVISTNIAETAACTEAANDMVDQGCKFIFADSFSHETYLLESAKANPTVQYSHATGTNAHTANQANFHNAFASIYEGRYLAGVAAGLKLKAMMDADSSVQPKLGYIGAYTYAEVISGYTSWFLGVQSVVPTATMEVQFTGSWYDEAGEKSAAELLIKNGAVLISQHADSWGAPTACETAKVPNVSYNGSTESKCPDTYIVSSKINWQPYFEYCLDAVINNKEIKTDWSAGLGDTIYTGSVCLAPLGKKAPAAGTEAKLNEVAGKLKDGSLKVFDCAKFTVGGEHLTTYLADVDTDPAYAKDTEVIKTANGVTYFAESEFRSAPYFDVQIDGITLLNAKY